MKEEWVIKVVYPNNREGMKWSEYAFARSLKKYLEKIGKHVTVHNIAQWNEETDADVVVVIRGQKEYFPKRNGKTIYIMWHLSHPDLVTLEQYNAYDYICVGSKVYLERLQGKTTTPLISMPICADLDIFYPDSEAEIKYDWIFVGNSKHIERKSVVWALNHKVPLHIWGKDWPEVIPEHTDRIVADHIHNDDLPELYRHSKATVNDHFDDMREHGFMNTRIIESLACGLPVISDYVHLYEEVFGDCVLFYRNEEEYLEQMQYLTEHYDEQRKKILDFRPKLNELYSFEARVKELVNLEKEICEREAFYKELVSVWMKRENPSLKAQLQVRLQDAKYGEEGTRLFRVLELFEVFMNESVQQSMEQNELQKILQNVRDAYAALDWTMRRALLTLTGREKLFFEFCIQDYLHQYETKRLESVYDLNYFYKDKYINSWKTKYENMHTKAKDYKGKAKQFKKELSSVKEELASSKKQLARLQTSRTYRLSKIIAAPIRMLRSDRK